MGRIKILPEILSNKIAAGEVVERPASVVKELVENAIDAKSTKIFVDIESGGRSLIRVSDNGIGMKGDDALLAIERYATSKIKDDNDLFSIKTLGFRGEALPSIASVSKFTIETKDEESDTGTKVTVQGGVIKNVEEISAAKGTVISVKTLFFNTPARRKFMKTVNTEMGHIGDIVAQTALGWNDIQFKLTHNGRVVKNWPKTESMKDRVLDIAGSDLKDDILPLSFSDEYISFKGFISTPKVFRSTSKKLFIFVNGRFIKDRGIAHAIFEGYKSRLVKGRFPVAVLYIDIDYNEVDVNVHPAKDEVRFSEHRRVYNTIRDEVAKTLKKSEMPKEASFNKSKIPFENEEVVEGYDNRVVPEKKSFQKIQEENDLWRYDESDDSVESFAVEPDEPEKYEEDEKKSYTKTESEGINSQKETGVNKEITSNKAEEGLLFKSSFFGGLRVCGQLSNTYILCESDNNDLVLIDQHAAHERIVFEEIKKIVLENRGEVQGLLLPETVDLSFKEAAELETVLPDLKKTGFEIEPFGDNTFVIKSVPAVLSDCDSSKIVQEIAEKAVTKDYSKRPDELLDDSLILMACHGAIRARQHLNYKEMEDLIKQLDSCENSFHCPHGRPTWIKYSESDIKKAFSRIV